MSSSSSTIPWAVGAPRRMHSEEQSSCAGLLRGTSRDTRRVATDPSSRWLPVSLGEQELHFLQRACLEARRLVDPAPVGAGVQPQGARYPRAGPRLRGCSLAICTVPYRRGFFTPACHLGGAIAPSTSFLSMKISGLPSSRKS